MIEAYLLHVVVDRNLCSKVETYSSKQKLMQYKKETYIEVNRNQFVLTLAIYMYITGYISMYQHV